MSKSKLPVVSSNAASPAGLSKSIMYRLCGNPLGAPKSTLSISSSDPSTESMFSAARRRKSMPPAGFALVPLVPYPMICACVSSVSGVNSIVQVGTSKAGVSSVAIATSASRNPVGSERSSYQTCSTL